LEQGFSYGGPDGTAFPLKDAVSASLKDAQIQGYEFLLRSTLSYGAIARSMNPAGAFDKSMDLVVANMVESFAKRLEAIMMYGQTGLGVVSGVVGLVVSLTTASYAPGLWSGGVGMRLTATDSTAATARNSSDVTPFQVTAVSLDNKSVTLNAVTGIVATDILWHFGALAAGTLSNMEFLGLKKIMTVSGTLFNISTATYGDIWKPTEFDCGGTALTFAKIQKSVAQAVGKGLNKDITILVNPRAWDNLLGDEAALRRYDETYSSKSVEKGSQSIKFYSQNGVIEIKPSIYVKEGDAFGIPKDSLMKIGSTDVTFKLPGAGEDKFFRQLESNAGVELRSYADFALFCHEPGKLILLKNIVNA
jgi:hypothetical protein